MALEPVKRRFEQPDENQFGGEAQDSASRPEGKEG